MHLVCRLQEHAPTPPKGDEERGCLQVLSILHCPRCSLPHRMPWWSIARAQELTPHLWIETVYPFQHTAHTFLFRNETVLRRPLGNETKMAFYFFFFFLPIHHFFSRPQVPGHPAWHNPELATSGSKWSHSFRVSKQKVHWKGHGGGCLSFLSRNLDAGCKGRNSVLWGAGQTHE